MKKRGIANHEGEIEDDCFTAESPDSDNSTGNGGENAMNNRAHPKAANKRQKQWSKVQAERRMQPRRTCKGTGMDVGLGKV